MNLSAQGDAVSGYPEARGSNEDPEATALLGAPSPLSRDRAAAPGHPGNPHGLPEALLQKSRRDS